MQGPMRRDALVLLASAGVALSGCSLDLKGEASAEDDSGSVTIPVSVDAAVTDATGVNVPDATSVRDAGDPEDTSVPEATDTMDRGRDTGIDAFVDVPKDANSPTDASVVDSTSPSDGGSACDFSGTWATKITIAVAWVPQGITSVFIAPGQGTIEQWAKSVRVQTGNTTTETNYVCGITLPDFSGTNFVGGETYGVRFPASLFDVTSPDGGWSSRIPPFTMTGTLSDSTPNATYTSTFSAALLGLTLANATTATWPTPIPAATIVDTDGDGNPGITVATATGPIAAGGGNYSNPPVDLSKTRANELYLVIRQVSSLSGAASDCDHMSGTAVIPKIPATSTGKYAIDSHIVGCGLVGGGNCSPSQTSFADGTQPVFSPSGTSVFTSARIGSTATCAMIRQLLP
jgi:hypothetical protein